jgi:hypothetical protein
MLLDANRDSRVMLRVADTGLLGLARGTMWIVSWKSGLTTDIRGPPCLATRSPRRFGAIFYLKIYGFGITSTTFYAMLGTSRTS